MKISKISFALALVLLPVAATENQVDFYSSAQLQDLGKTLRAEADSNSSALVAHPLQKYPNDYTQIVYRNATGMAELHQNFSDLYVVVAGDATLLSGGDLVDPKTISEGELNAKAINGGHSQDLHAGDIVHIQPNTPHQLLLQHGHTFSYFVLKIKE